MRSIKALVLAVVAWLGAVAPGSLGENAAGPCADRFPCVRMRLPAPITITTGPATFRIARDGWLRRSPNPRNPFPRAAVWFPGTGTWYMIEHRHLVVGRGRQRLWRSREQIKSSQVGLVMASSHMVAFQHDHMLYLATFGGAERPIAHREAPLGWTRGGLYTYRYQGRELVMRSDRGALVRVIARRSVDSDYQVANGSLYFISRGVLMRAHAAHTQRLVPLKRLGLSAHPWLLQPLDRLVELQDAHRLVVVRADGSVFAWTPLPRSEGQADSIVASGVVDPRGGALAFAGLGDQTSSQTGGTETVYLLRSGAHSAAPVHSEHGSFGGCARWADLAWHGKWLLYSATEGHLAVIDTTGAHRTIELGSMVRNALGARVGSFSAYWSGQPIGY